MSEQARIDKWLWAVRIYKTRSIAAEACKKGHISIGGRTAKPAHNIRVGDIVNVKSPSEDLHHFEKLDMKLFRH